MTKDAAHELQVAIVNALKADPDVAALVGIRIFDVVPAKDGKITAEFPYISFGPVQDLPEDADCIEASEPGHPVRCLVPRSRLYGRPQDRQGHQKGSG